MSGRVVVPALLACAACAAPKEPAFGDGLMHIDTVTDGTRVASTSPATPFSMVFGTTADLAVAMPVSWSVGMRELVDHEGHCPTESGVGLAAYPALCVYAPIDGGPTPGTPEHHATSTKLDVDIAGPSVVRMGAYFDISYDCGGTHRASGESFFTLLPNGRVFRHDANYHVVDEGDTLMVPPTGSGCHDQQAADIYVTSFFTVTTQMLLDTADQTATEGPDADLICARWANDGKGDPLVLGVHWFDPGYKRPQANGGLSSFVFDLSGDVTSVSGSTAYHLEQELRIAPNTTSCKTLAALMLREPQVLLDGIAMEFHEGLYVEPTPHPAGFTLSAPSDGGIAEGFGISVDLGGADHVELVRGGSTTTLGNVTFAPDDAETPDDPSDDRLVIWFDDGIGAGDTIRVEPR